MAQVKKSAVTLRIMGDDLDPDQIAKLLGISPSFAEKKGDQIIDKMTGRMRIAKSGIWRLCTRDREPEDIDGQIEEILDQLTSDLSVWQVITKRFHADLFCGLFMEEANEGLTISVKTLTALGVRGIHLDFDIYSPGEGENGKV